jgi:hypothetical protein
MMTVCHQDWKQKYQGQHDMEVVANVTCTLPKRRKNGDTPVGYSGQATLRREQCNITGVANMFP